MSLCIFLPFPGGALTNPLDGIRNEMFKTNKSLVRAVNALMEDMG